MIRDNKRPQGVAWDPLNQFIAVTGLDRWVSGGFVGIICIEFLAYLMSLCYGIVVCMQSKINRPYFRVSCVFHSVNFVVASYLFLSGPIKFIGPAISLELTM